MEHLKSIWLDLKEGFEQVFRKEPIGRNRFIELYNDVYSICTAYDDEERIPMCKNSDEASQLVGNELYLRVDQFLEDHVKEIAFDAIDLDGEDLLRYYSTQWSDYLSSSQLLNKICSHLNSDWVTNEIAYGHMDIHFIYELAIVKWREIVFEAVHDKVTSATLELIEMGQRGDQVDFLLIKQIVNSYVELGKSRKTRPLICPSIVMHMRHGYAVTTAFGNWRAMVLWHLKWILMFICG